MPSTTPVYRLPYPLPSDPPDVPHDIRALAEALEYLFGTGAIGGGGSGGGGGGGGTGIVERVSGTNGIAVSGTDAFPLVGIDRSVTDSWYSPSPQTENRVTAAEGRITGVETRLAGFDERIDALVGQLVFIGTYNAATQKIETLSYTAVSEFPNWVPTGYKDAIGRSMVDIPAAPWNAKHFFIVSAEGPTSATDGIDQPTGSNEQMYRIGDWLISNGRGALDRVDPLTGTPSTVQVPPIMPAEANSWLHMSYASRTTVAAGVVVDTIHAGLPVTENTVQLALRYLNTSMVSGSRTVTAGAGLTGGGPLSSNITLAVGGGNGIDVQPDNILVKLDTRADNAIKIGPSGGLYHPNPAIPGAGNGLFLQNGEYHIGTVANSGITVSADLISVDTNRLDAIYERRGAVKDTISKNWYHFQSHTGGSLEHWDGAYQACGVYDVQAPTSYWSICVAKLYMHAGVSNVGGNEENGYAKIRMRLSRDGHGIGYSDQHIPGNGDFTLTFAWVFTTSPGQVISGAFARNAHWTVGVHKTEMGLAFFESNSARSASDIVVPETAPAFFDDPEEPPSLHTWTPHKYSTLSGGEIKYHPTDLAWLNRRVASVGTWSGGSLTKQSEYGNTPWPAGEFTALGDGSKARWDGNAFVAVP